VTTLGQERMVIGLSFNGSGSSPAAQKDEHGHTVMFLSSNSSSRTWSQDLVDIDV
jgi:hypothetical protein